MGTLLILTTTVHCRNYYYVTPPIYSSKMTVARGRISSCAVVEEGVPVCRDPEDTDDRYRSVTRTPYPRNGLEAVKGSGNGSRRDPSSSSSSAVMEEEMKERKKGMSANRESRAWWLFGGGATDLPKRTRVETVQRTPVVHRYTSSWPEMIVTYLIKGCSPTEVPFNLSPCSARGVDDVVDNSGSRNDQQQQRPVKPVIISTTRVIYYVPPSTDDFYAATEYDLPSVLV